MMLYCILFSLSSLLPVLPLPHLILSFHSTMTEVSHTFLLALGTCRNPEVLLGINGPFKAQLGTSRLIRCSSFFCRQIGSFEILRCCMLSYALA